VKARRGKKGDSVLDDSVVLDGDQEEGDESDENLSSKNINKSPMKLAGSSKSNLRYRKKSGIVRGSKSNKAKEPSNLREQQDEKVEYRSGAALDVSSVQDIEPD
jgi:hypothetical protein